MSESDGIEDAFEGQLRVGLLIAGRVAEELARQREQSDRAAEQQSAQAVRDLQERVVAERTTVRAALVPLERDAWWDRARPTDIEAAWQTARQWADVEPDAARAAQTIREEVAARYGIDVDTFEADRRTLGRRHEVFGRAFDERAAQAAEQSQQHRSEADKEAVIATLLVGEAADERAAAAGVDTSETLTPAGAGEGARLHLTERRAAAAADVAGSTTAPHTRTVSDDAFAVQIGTNGHPGLGYDSPQRRDATARHLHASVGAEHVEAVEARMSADVANAHPASAVASVRGRSGAYGGRRRTSLDLQSKRVDEVER